MLFIKISVDISLLIGLTFSALVIGFLLRSGQLRKLKGKISDLEKEMMASHAEILELQRDRIALEEKIKGSSNIPVIPITAKDEKKPEKMQDKTAGKK